MSLATRAEAAAKFPTKTTHGTDHKAWAKRFVYRAERGDRELLPIQVEFAYLALGIPDPNKKTTPPAK